MKAEHLGRWGMERKEEENRGERDGWGGHTNCRCRLRQRARRSRPNIIFSLLSPSPSLPLSFITPHGNFSSPMHFSSPLPFIYCSILCLLHLPQSSHGNQKLQVTISIILIFLLFIILNFKISENKDDLIQ